MPSRTQRGIVDRIEGTTAVLLLGEDESVRVQVPAAWLPPGSGEGTVLQVTLAIDRGATEEGAADAQSLIEELRRRP